MAPAAVKFTSQERDMSIRDAMNDQTLRPRVLQYVAAKRGLSTGDALKFIDGQLSRELGIIPGSRPVALGTGLDHLDHPYLDGPPSVGKGAALDADYRAVFNDGKLLDRVVRALAMDQDGDYVKALEQLHDGADAAHQARKRTLRAVLGGTKAKPEDVDANLTMLERRDAAVTAVHRLEMEPIMLEQTDSQGLVLLDQGDADGNGDGSAVTVDIGLALADPVERERRLARARKVAPSDYSGDKGRQEFFEMDRFHLEAGIDVVRTMERGREIQAAQRKAESVARQLDQEIGSTLDKRQQLRMLDAEIAKLQDKRRPLQDAATQQETKLRMLQAPPAAEGTTGPSSGSGIPSTIIQTRIIDELQANPDESYEDARRRVLEAAEPGIPITLEQESAEWARGNYKLSMDPLRVHEEPAEPPPAENDLNQRVRDRMRELGRPESDYPRTLEEIIAEDPDARW